MELARRLGVKQPTAWAMKHKIMAVMARREGEMRLSGRVEMDDAYLGASRAMTGTRAGRARTAPAARSALRAPPIGSTLPSGSNKNRQTKGGDGR